MIYFVMVRDILHSRGLSPWYGITRKLQELGRACVFPGTARIIANKPERRVCEDGAQAVGLTHSRGVADVTVSEFW